jgi:hypothetical protein
MGNMPLTNNSSFTQAEGLSEGSRGLERQRKPPVRSQNKYDPERVAETQIGTVLAPFQGAFESARFPGVSFYSTPGYLLTSLRLDKIKAAVFDCL